MTDMPTWEEFMLPTLCVMSDGVIRHWREFQPLVADKANLTEEQKTEMLPSGSQLKYENRIGWGVSYLTNVGALLRPKRGHYQITDAGRQLVQLFPNGVKVRDIEILGADPESPIRVYESSGPRTKHAETTADADATSMTPIEQVQSGIARIQQEIAAELLERLQGKEPGFFEQAVVQLLLAMGYGGTTGTGTTTQLSNDGGIDGVIDQDVLGLSRVYIQAKRYADGNVVGRPDLQAFVGALSGKADSGVFITTSRFSDGAKFYAQTVPTRIVLIDGKLLTRLMIRYGVGVQVRETFEAVEIDEDFFA
ncbi:restriction endonuclease [Propionimicrobium sp. PCR01-08-3]|uniref:restriction endonuclease n=1 Tax=Propionimicrobium sp. PCR01-08-3 TaxID=3052086 RepID=UPI00255C2A8E|nr:restriction endonuclease [Propionimicrobium sp. PCR01-08-3]WIY82944.1 restriction endonuclease [Propionimicrobium sp. PCR01-08-3]